MISLCGKRWAGEVVGDLGEVVVDLASRLNSTAYQELWVSWMERRQEGCSNSSSGSTSVDLRVTTPELSPRGLDSDR